MERRHFLKLTLGFVAGGAALAASAKAAPLPPVSAGQNLMPPRGETAEPAVVSQDDVDRLKPEEVRWGHHWHGHRHWHAGIGAGAAVTGVGTGAGTIGVTGAGIGTGTVVTGEGRAGHNICVIQLL